MYNYTKTSFKFKKMIAVIIQKTQVSIKVSIKAKFRIYGEST